MPVRFLVLFCLALFLFVTPAQADFKEGFKAYHAKEWKDAIFNLRPLAEKGDTRAMILLANMYGEGFGVIKDPLVSYELYLRAAASGNLDGMLALGAIYEQGIGVDKNTPLSFAWFERAAKSGSQAGAFFTAIYLYKGAKGKDYDIKPDHAASYKWFRIAANSRTKVTIAQAAEAFAAAISRQTRVKNIVELDKEVEAWKPVDPESFSDIPEKAYLKKRGIDLQLPWQQYPKESKPNESTQSLPDGTAPESGSGKSSP